MSLAPERERADGRHRIRRLGGPATAVTATIAAGSLALAAYTATSTAGAPSDAARASIGQTDPVLASESVAAIDPQTGARAGQAYAEARKLRAEQGAEALSLSTDLTASGLSAVREASEAISAQKRAEREAAAREAAEKAAAEQAAADRAAQERAAQEAAEREAAERAQAEAASRSAERQSAPAQQSQPAQQPAPAPAPVSSGDSRSIARSMLASYGWGDDQWGCLDSLWMRESGWSHTAMNPSSGAYGIPQSLPGNKMASAGADWQTNPATQITWGLGYISGRYGSPCNAWAHSESVGWY